MSKKHKKQQKDFYEEVIVINSIAVINWTDPMNKPSFEEHKTSKLFKKR